MVTNSPHWHGPTVDVGDRARGRCENRIKTLKNRGLGKLPFFQDNQAWVNIATLAMNLLSWRQLALLPNGCTARDSDVKRLRYRLLVIAGTLVTRAIRSSVWGCSPSPSSRTPTSQASKRRGCGAQERLFVSKRG